MTKEIRHVIEHSRFRWSLDDVIVPALELWLLYYLANRGYENLQTDTSVFQKVQDVLLMAVALTGMGFFFRRIWQLNSFTVVETPLGMEENFLFALDRVKMFHIGKREFDKWNYCVGVKANSDVNPFDFWLTVICYENKVYVNERPAFYLLSLWWQRAGANKMIDVFKALRAGGPPYAAEEMSRIYAEMAQHEADVANGIKVPSDPWERNIVVDPGAPAFYSRQNVSMFSFLFSAIAGAVLLSFNVKGPDKWKVILLGTAFSFTAAVLLTLLPKSLFILFFVNTVGAGFVSNLLWNKYVSKEIKFRVRPLWIPFVIICFLIFVPLTWYYIYFA